MSVYEPGKMKYYQSGYVLFSYFSYSILLILFLSCTSGLIMRAKAATKLQRNDTVLAIQAFGDSFLDTGNNNNLISITKSNFPPYGRDFPGAKPTGRFCNGRVISDMMGTIIYFYIYLYIY